ncbi:arginine:ornithine antiporter/lysine permease [Peribacillus deserti]|uniref:Arginine:ornithine antiporter/lysine permease n=1 Tax=Peribacillus deserti TaxID=673318 RepID=A0ABS2QD13_9BACI|nr:amino acid permease [Peribacillus deserti]MBM7691029.1 arginine:ornithine antiporter/lysine permease [Peribacillus deserti]
MNKKWGLWILTTFVIGNMVGSGVFMLPANLSQVSSPLGTITAWGVTGLGVLMIALVFGNLSTRKPELKTGPQSYAMDMFKSPKAGKTAGYSMAWGYWAANWAATASVIISFAGYLSTFFPVLESRQILLSIGSFDLEAGKALTLLVCSVLLWGIQFIVSRSFNSAGKLNLAATAAKVIGFALFVIITLAIFDASSILKGVSFNDSEGNAVSLGGQINSAAIATLWAFVGIEAAVMLSNRAKSQKDVKKATLIGLLVAVLIYVGITTLTMGVLPQEQLQDSQKPLVDALNAAIGSSAASIIGILALVSLFGAAVGWIVVSSEVPYQAAKQGLFPSFFGKTNKNGAPVGSLTITNIMTQIFLFSTVSGTISEAYDFAIVVATLAYLIPYLVSAIYSLKLVITGETYDVINGSRVKDGIITVLALIYSLWVIKTGTADLKTFLLGMGLFVVGLLLYPVLMKPKQTEITVLKEKEQY